MGFTSSQANTMEFALRTRERFLCQPASRRREMEVLLEAENPSVRREHPRRACGSETKRVYSKPVLRELSKAEAMVRFGYSMPAKVPVAKCCNDRAKGFAGS
jgi:hypothetical protein